MFVHIYRRDGSEVHKSVSRVTTGTLREFSWFVVAATDPLLRVNVDSVVLILGTLGSPDFQGMKMDTVRYFWIEED